MFYEPFYTALKTMKEKRYCMNCLYTSKEAYCYKRHDPCFKFDAKKCPFYETSFFEYTTYESSTHGNVGQPRFISRLLGCWLKRLKWRKR